VARRRRVTAPGKPGPIVDSKADAIAELMLDVAQCFFRLRAFGQKAGFITSWGGGAFGFMRSLAVLGPLTVPQIAQMRPTSRQRMQRLADELAAEGLVRFIDNPKHRRSKLVQLTPKGQSRYRDLNAQLLATASTMAVARSEADIRRTSAIVRQLSDEASVAAKDRQRISARGAARRREHGEGTGDDQHGGSERHAQRIQSGRES
jgi:DNA-binding MarR family transcriptional regulator